MADFAFGLTYFPRLSVRRIYDEIRIANLIIIAYSIGIFLMCASVMNLCVLTLDRYLAIVKPMKYATFLTTKRVALLISAAWGVAFLGALVPYLALFFTTSGKDTISCTGNSGCSLIF